MSVEHIPHPLEDSIRFTFASSEKPDYDLMADVVMVQNLFIKSLFDGELYGEEEPVAPDDSLYEESGITISSAIKQQMLSSHILKEVLAKHGVLADSIAFVR
jgi:hypothetical protein